MNVVAIAAVKNEIDIVEAFVRHTLTYANRLVVLDNGSTDGTLSVLRALAAEGLPLTIVEDPSLGYYQSQRMTHLMKAHAIETYDADWVLALDADEFVSVPEGRCLVDETTSTDQPIALPWHNYVPVAEDDPAEVNPVLRIQNRVGEFPDVVKMLVPRRLAALPDAVLGQGSHEFELAGKPVAPVPHDGAYLAHYPVRSPGQYLQKIAVSVLQYKAMPQRDIQRASNYLGPYELLKRDPQAFLAGYAIVARHYYLAHRIADPPLLRGSFSYRGGTLRHTPTVDDTTRGWLALLHYSEDLVRKYGILSRCHSEGGVAATEPYVRLIADLRKNNEDLALQLIQKERVIQNQHRELMHRDRPRLERRLLAKIWRVCRSLGTAARRFSAKNLLKTGFARFTGATVRQAARKDG